MNGSVALELSKVFLQIVLHENDDAIYWFILFFHILAEVSNIASPIIPVGGSSNGKRRGPNPLSTYLKDRWWFFRILFIKLSSHRKTNE
jgi:hypothetical protein